jgi:hypothetical protein
MSDPKISSSNIPDSSLLKRCYLKIMYIVILNTVNINFETLWNKRLVRTKGMFVTF